MYSIRKLMITGSLAGAIAFGGALLVDNRTAEACLHPPKEFQFPIKAGSQKGLVFFADGREQLVIRPSYTVEGEGLVVKNDAVEGFNTLAWIVPVPNLPDTYEEADAKLFSELAEFTKPIEDPAQDDKRNALGNDWHDSEKEKDGAEFLEQVKVGDYTIQPVKAKGEMGGLELNRWLTDNGFGSVDEKVMKHYIDKGYYWLAVKLNNAKGLPANGEVKPLRIGFATDKPTFPIKINQGRGSFDLELWVITSKQIDTDKTKAQGLKTVKQQDDEMVQSNQKTTFSRLPEVVKEVANDDEALKNLKTGDLYCYRFFGAGMDGDCDLSKLDEDFTFTFKEEKPATK
ncbi:MAG: DUF2330 domain-containing protein [Planctomycetes bacterium]|nr:DUF2330 domain-containing protein [Planctomycetota bacterium]